MNPISPARPKNLATNTVAWPWASEFSIHCRHGLRMHDSLHPLRRTRHPLQLMMMMIFSFFFSADLKTKHLLPSAAPWSDPTYPSYLKISWRSRTPTTDWLFSRTAAGFCRWFFRRIETSRRQPPSHPWLLSCCIIWWRRSRSFSCN